MTFFWAKGKGQEVNRGDDMGNLVDDTLSRPKREDRTPCVWNLLTIHWTESLSHESQFSRAKFWII